MQVVSKRLIFLKMATKICECCGKKFSPVSSRVKFCEKCRLKKEKACAKAYNKSEKRKAYKKAYHQSEKYKAYQKDYQQSEKYKAYKKAYQQSEKSKAYQKAYQKAYRQSEKYKAYQKAYQQSEKSKAYQKALYQNNMTNITDSYLKMLDIPPELYDLKRAQLQLLRACRE